MTLKKRLLLAALFIVLFLVFLNVHRQTTYQKDPTDSFLVGLTLPVLEVADNLSGGVLKIWDGYFALVGAKEENRLLKKKVALQNLQILSLQEQGTDETRQKNFSQALDVMGLQGFTARVLSFDPYAESQAIWIDAGSLKGVTIDGPVVTPDGLVGRVIKVFPKMSEILLVADPHFSVDTLNQRTRVRGLVVGSGRGARLKRLPLLSHLEFLKLGDEMKPGDLLLTSGESRIYPAGIAVGRVMKDLLVLPQVDFTTLEEVILLTGKK